METNQEKQQAFPPRKIFRDNGMVIYGDPELRKNQIDNEIVGAHGPEDGGLLLYAKGDMFPSKGWPFREAIIGIDIAKRAAINSIKLISKKPFVYLMGIFLILPSFIKTKFIKAAIRQYVDLTDTMFLRLGAYTKPEFWSDMVREVYRAGIKMAGGDEDMKKFVDTICMILEYDDAYRYRVQDIAELINMDEIEKNTTKELKRVLMIAKERGEGTSTKFDTFIKALPLIMRIRTVRKTIQTFFSKLNITNLYLSKEDWYKCMIWGGYKFRGIPDDQRVSMRMMIDADLMNKNNPQEYKKVTQNNFIQ